MLGKVRQAVEIGKTEGIRSLCRSIDSHLRVQTATNLNRRINHWRGGAKYNTAGRSIFAEDWDNLIILDACRLAEFREYNSLSGQLESRVSRGSTTKEWVRGTFHDEQRYDTVYISDNPWYGRLFEELNSDVYQYQVGSRDAFDGAVTHPDTMTELAIEHVKQHPQKRVIVHYLQPHDPWFHQDGTERFALEHHTQSRLREDGYTETKIREAYTDSLQLVLAEVERLLTHLEGKTVITADHGELLNNRMTPIPLKRYEHPEGVYANELVHVPWFVVEFEERKEIVDAGESGDWEWTDPDARGVEEQLEGLGYL